jgi:type I restriction enzyme M protein
MDYAAHIAQITRAYLDLADTGKKAVDGLKTQVFDNRDFGYWKVAVERPLRKSAQFTAGRIESLRFDKRLAEEMQWIYQQWGEQVYEPGFLSAKEQKDALDDWLEKEEIDRKTADKKKLLDPKFWTAKRDLLQAGEQLHQHFGDALSHDFNQFQKDVKAALKKRKLKLGAPQLKTILEAVSWRDPEAEPVGGSTTMFELEPGVSPKNLRPWYSAIEDGCGVTYEPDSELRDTENVPLNYEGGIEAYFQSEVLPHVSRTPGSTRARPSSATKSPSTNTSTSTNRCATSTKWCGKSATSKPRPKASWKKFSTLISFAAN